MRAVLLLALLTLAPRAAADAPVPPLVQTALDDALLVAGARAVVMGYEPRTPARCTPQSAQVPRPIAGSGKVAVKLLGKGCSGWAWAKVQVMAPALVTTRPVRAGEPLDGAVTSMEREVSTGRTPAVLSAGAVASRALPRGLMLEAGHIRGAGPGAGDAIKVIVRSGPLVIEAHGRSVSCGRGRVCAVLPSGKHVEGQLVAGSLLVEVP